MNYRGKGDIVREKTVCFTGHRPERFMVSEGISNNIIQMVKSMLFYQIKQAIDDGYEYFISGVARGVDIWAAQYVLELKNKYPYIKLICAKPFADHEKNFKGNDLWELQNVLNNADEIVNVSEDYSRYCYSLRNKYMVDNSSRVIAVLKSYNSGTGQTIRYANKKGIEVKFIKVDELPLSQCNKNVSDNGKYYFT